VIDGVEVSALHLEQATTIDVYDTLYLDLNDVPRRYDLAVLAVPTDQALALLSATSTVSTFVMDVCSVKTSICNAATQLGLIACFAPTHPMAGLAVTGPSLATADLFKNQSWIMIEGWAACDIVRPLIAGTEARVVPVESAQQHDIAMSAASHSVHLASLSVIIAFQEAQKIQNSDWRQMTGPGFRDVTRLSAAASSFWTQTLLDNHGPVRKQLKLIKDIISRFEHVLETNDSVELENLLKYAEESHHDWKRGASSYNP